MRKYFVIFLLLSIFPINIYAQNAVAPADSSIENIKNIIINHTPEFISKNISLIAEKIEEFRSATGATLEANKVAIEAKLKELEDDKSSIKAKVGASEIIKPIEYAKLFGYKTGSFIFNTKLIFYGLLAVIVLYIARFVLRLIF